MRSNKLPKNIGKYLLIGTLAALTGCGIMDEMRAACVPGDLQGLCYAVMGQPDKEYDDTALKEDVAKNEAEIARLQNEIANLQIAIQEYISIMDQADVNLQDSIDALTVRVAELETQLGVIEIIELCDDGPGYDEILLRLSDNTILAYFEIGSKRFLTRLIPGTYITTDGTNCLFTITDNYEVVF